MEASLLATLTTLVTAPSWVAAPVFAVVVLEAGMATASAAPQWQCPGGPPRGGGSGPPRAGGGASSGGPGDTVGPRPTPPRDTGGPPVDPTGPTTPRDPGSPTAPASPTGPTTPTGPGAGPGPLAPGRGPASGGPRGSSLVESYDAWHLWWEFNKDRFLELRRSMDEAATNTGDDDIAIGRSTATPLPSSRPSSRDVQQTIVPLLLDLVHDARTPRSVVASALLSLARIGDVPSLQDAVRHVLATGDTERREIATLCYGIDGRSNMLGDLVALASDAMSGRKLLNSEGPVPKRVRAFACYASGLLAERGNVVDKRRVFFLVRDLLEARRTSTQDIQVAALSALRILTPSVETEAGRALRDDALYWLDGFLASKKLEPLLGSHALVAAAALAGRADPATRVARRATSVLDDKDVPQVLRQAACLALGKVVHREDRASLEALRRECGEGRDPQTRSFATMALGEAGGDDNIAFLRRRLRSSKARNDSLPWLALALAVAATDSSEALRASLRHDLFEAYEGVRAPEFSSGIAVALGLLRATEAEERIAERMLEIKSQSREAGYHALALGLMRARGKTGDLRRLMDQSAARPEALVQSATGLALLGDKSVTHWLVDRLAKDSTSIEVRHGLTRALGLVGDKPALDSLLALARDDKAMALPRAFAVVALGMIGDQDDLPWNASLASGVHYRASVGTLTGEVGVLDIL